MAEPPRRSRRLRGESPEVISVADLLRQARRLRGEPPREIRPRLEGLKLLVSPGGTRLLSPEEEYDPEAIEVSELTTRIASTSAISEDPQISEPVTPSSSGPSSPKVERVITEDLPSGLISIEDITPEPDRASSLEDDIISLDLRESESLFYSPPRATTWYLSLTNFLDNSVGLSPPRFPFSPRILTPPAYMSSPSSPNAYLYGGPSVPIGYQSISGTFSGASPRPYEQKLLAGSSGSSQLSAEEILMMSGQPQGSQFPPGGQPQGQYVPTGQYLPQGQP